MADLLQEARQYGQCQADAGGIKDDGRQDDGEHVLHWKAQNLSLISSLSMINLKINGSGDQI
ncbi:hypothetical protein [Rhizobium sp. BK376]|uniref:hypothetical protein n=1 Tax=Rhizobium sp. BK376 TaxID=2512149 RepID=UPI001FE051C4|nr:hypothetical protein [Rhizobium sp. BK376]